VAAVLNEFVHWARDACVLDLIGLPGVMILAAWLLRTGLGRRALDGTPVRRNCLTFEPLLALVLWLAPSMLFNQALDSYLSRLSAWRAELMVNILGAVAALPVVILVLIIGQIRFARGLKGMGLRSCGIIKDAYGAFINFLATLSIFLVTIQLTMWVGRWIGGSDYQIERHKELRLLVEYPHWSLRISIILMAVFVAPLVEEMLFRGLVQSTIRAHLGRPWPAIFLASLMFASVHQNLDHWPALFVLGVGIGYAYERSGSLWRAIFVHAMFNGLTIISQMVEVA